MVTEAAGERLVTGAAAEFPSDAVGGAAAGVDVAGVDALVVVGDADGGAVGGFVAAALGAEAEVVIVKVAA